MFVYLLEGRFGPVRHGLQPFAAFLQLRQHYLLLVGLLHGYVQRLGLLVLLQKRLKFLALLFSFILHLLQLLKVLTNLRLFLFSLLHRAHNIIYMH